MNGFLVVCFLVALVVVGSVLHLVCLYLHLRWRSHLLEQQLQMHQKRMEEAFTEIHNGPLQLLAFLMREVQIHEVTQQDLLKHLHEVYQEVLVGVQKLQEHDSKNP
jgi:hypothetical protein